MSRKQKKQKKRKKRRKAGGNASRDLPPVDPKAAEKSMAQLGRILKDREFDSIEEANAFLEGMTESGDIPSLPPSTPLERAQDIMYEAWDSQGDQRVALARQALEISEDCADAYVLLAEEAAETFEEIRDLYERGVRAGERALGPEAFEEDAGHFWGILETRPYMRARAGLAAILWLQGERRKAIEHYWDMLRLNPNDNQGVRDILINYLLEAGDDTGARELLGRYEDDASGCWAYSRALLAFRKGGAGGEADTYLDEAVECNRHVPLFLVGKKRMPKHPPQYIGFGDENEAVAYAMDAIMAWTKTEGAIDWVRARTGGTGMRGGDTGSTSRGRTSSPGNTMSSESKNAMLSPVLLERLYSAAGRFREIECWNWMWDSDLFGVRNPADGVTAYCSVMGRNGEHFAIAAYLGSEGLSGYYRLRDEEIRLHYIDAYLSQRFLTVSFEDEEELDEEDKRELEDVGYRAAGPHAWPRIRSHSPGLEPWHVNAREAEFFIHILEQAIEVALRFRKNPGILTPPGGEGYLVRVPERGTDGLQWRDAWIKLFITDECAVPAEPLDEVRIARIRKNIARTADTWEMDYYYLPGLVTDEGDRAYFPRVLLCVDHESPTIFGFHTASPSGYLTEFPQQLMFFIEKAERLPDTILTGKKETARMLEPVATALGIDVKLSEDIDRLMEATAGLHNYLSTGEGVETEDEPPLSEGVGPAAHDRRAARGRKLPGFEELSPMEAEILIFSPFDPEASPLLIDTNVDDAEIRTTRFIDHIIRYLDLIREREPVKLTQKGNLPLKLVRELRDMNFPAYESLWIDDIPIRGEEDAPYIHTINLLTRLAGFTKKRHGKLTLTNKYKKTFERYSAGELYRYLLEVFATKYNWGYEDRYDTSPIIQHGFAFSLYLVGTHGGEKREARFYANRFLDAFPMAVGDFTGTSYSSPRETFESCYCLRVLKRFMKRFGLIDISAEEDSEWKTENKMVIKTELFDKLIRWRLSAR